MKGKILGYDGSSGAILGENGQRFRMESARWKAPRAPQVGEEVDFVEDGDHADEIYPLKSGSGLFSGAAGIDTVRLQEQISASAESPAAARIVAFAKSRYDALVALAMLMASLFFSYIDFGAGRMEDGIALVSVNGTLGDQIDQTSQFAGMFGADDGALAALTLLVRLSLLFWIVPPLAAWVLWKAWQGGKAKVAEKFLALCGIASLVYYWILTTAIGAAVESMAGPFGAGASDMFSLGFGGWVLAAGGIAFFVLRRRAARSTPSEEIA